MIVREPGHVDNDRCFTPDHIGCPAFTAHGVESAGTGQCPYLQEALIQFCGAASVAKFIPYSEAVLSQCGTDSHNYCELFLSIAQPDHHQLPAAEDDPSNDRADRCHEHVVDGMRVPGWLWYSPNHMWMDIGDHGIVHIGVDAFLAAMLGSIDGISFVTTHGFCRPALYLSVRGIDLHLVFPREVSISHPNAALNVHPGRLFSDPYTRGWLFEAELDVDASSSSKRAPVQKGLRTGAAAAVWMREELQRASLWAHRMSSCDDERIGMVMADGGSVQAGIVQHLQREQALQLFNEFFSPLANWKESR